MLVSACSQVLISYETPVIHNLLMLIQHSSKAAWLTSLSKHKIWYLQCRVDGNITSFLLQNKLSATKCNK